MGQTDGTVLCTGCSKSYKWKPELAGKKAKCKCGASVQFPKQAPAAPPEPELPDPPQTTGEYDLHDLTQPTNRTPPPKPAPVANGRRASKKGVCVDCGKPLPKGAVLCMACGMNQTTGRRIETAIDKLPMALAAELRKGPAKTAGNKSKWVALAAVVLILAAGAYVAMYYYPGFAVDKPPASLPPQPQHTVQSDTPASPAPAAPDSDASAAG
jgi:hypothetical protein